VTHRKFARRKSKERRQECLRHETGKEQRLSIFERALWRQTVLDRGAGIAAGWQRRRWLRGTDRSQGMAPGLGLGDIDEHRLGVLRRGVKSEMLRAYVVIKETSAYSQSLAAHVFTSFMLVSLARAVIARSFSRFPALQHRAA